MSYNCRTPPSRHGQGGSRNSQQRQQIARYCDSITTEAEANPAMIGEIIRDLHCVFEKTYGRKNSAEARFRSLASEVEDLKDDLACCECCKEELENELIKLHPELKALQFALEEEIQKRACLESIINQLRAQLARADAMLDADSRDKAALQARIKDLEAQLSKLQDMNDCLSSDKDDILRDFRSLEDTKVRQDQAGMNNCEKICYLEDALAKCCKANEELQKELIQMAKERDCLIKALEDCHLEKIKMCEDFERQRRQWREEKDRMEQMISDLRKAVECLTAQNQEICDKMREVVSAHHREMEKLRKEAEKYKRLYENEKKERERLEDALKKCEERNRRAQQEAQQAPQSSSQSQAQQEFKNPCADILAKINSKYGNSTNTAPCYGGGGGGAYGSSVGGGSSLANDNHFDDSKQVSNLKEQLKKSQNSNSQQEEKIKKLESELQRTKGKQLSDVVRVRSGDSDSSFSEDELEIEQNEESTAKGDENGNPTQRDREELIKLQLVSEEEARRREKLAAELEIIQKRLDDEMKSKEELKQKLMSQAISLQRLDMDTLKMEHLQDKLTTLESNQTSNEETISELEEKLTRLQHELNKAVAEKKYLKEELETIRKKSVTLQDLMEKERKSRTTIQKDLDDAEERLHSQITENSHLLDKISTLDNNNSELQRNQEELEQLKEKLRQESKNKATAEGLMSKLEMAEANNARVDELLQKLKRAEMECNQVKDLKERLQNTEAEKIQLLELERQIQTTHAEEIRLKEMELQIQSEEIESKRDELEDLRQKLKVAGEYKSQLTEMQEKIQRLVENKVELEDMLKKFKHIFEEDKCELEEMRVKVKNADLKIREMDDIRLALRNADLEKIQIEELQSKLCLAQIKLNEAEDMRQELKRVQQDKCTIEEHLNELKDRLSGVEPKLEELSEQRRHIEARLSSVVEENAKLKTNAEENLVSRDLAHRELQDVQSMWETEVKAKGILAEKIAKYERIISQTDAKTKQDVEHLERLKEKARQFKVELKAEREQSNKLKLKIDYLKEQLRTARDQLQEVANDPTAAKLADQLDKQKLEHAKVLQQIANEREALMAEFYRLGQEKNCLDKEVAELKGRQANATSHDKETIQELLASKERLESEMLSIKTLVNKRYVEKSVLDSMRKDHEANIMALKSKFETQAEQEVAVKLNHIGALLDNQNRDRTMIDSIRNANETTLRNEFNAMVKNMKLDIERLNGLLQAREEEITTLRTCVTRFKDKVSVETMEKNELLRKLQNLSTSQECIFE